MTIDDDERGVPQESCSPLRAKLRMINGLCKRYDDLYHEVAVALGISDSAFAVLYGICDMGEGCAQRDICATSWISKQTINSCVSKLRKDGLIRLEPGHGKEMRLYLTDEGRTKASQTVECVLNQEEAVLASLQPSEVDRLIELMALHVERLETNLAPLMASDRQRSRDFA